VIGVAILLSVAASTTGLPPAPPTPSPFEPDVAIAVATSLVSGDLADGEKSLTDNAQIARTTKLPGSDFEVEFEGRGQQAFVDQAKYLIGVLGKPKSVECIASAFICKFAFSKTDRMLLAGMQTRNHKVEFVQFIYMTRELALEKMKAKGANH
jgi:hypothetical protein